MAVSTSSSSAHFLRPNPVVCKPNHPLPASARFPRVRVFAACATTAERTSPCIASSPSPSSFYEVLGIQMGATCQEIKSAYRRLARVLHPDVASAKRENTAWEFMKIHEAYSTLSDPEKRADYDRMLFGRRVTPVGSRLETSISVYPTGVVRSSSSVAGFSGYKGRRTWETDQCW